MKHPKEAIPDPKNKQPVAPERKGEEPAEDVEEKSPQVTEPPKMNAEGKKDQKIVNEQEQDKITNDTTFSATGEQEENK